MHGRRAKVGAEKGGEHSKETQLRADDLEVDEDFGHEGEVGRTYRQGKGKEEFLIYKFVIICNFNYDHDVHQKVPFFYRLNTPQTSLLYPLPSLPQNIRRIISK